MFFKGSRYEKVATATYTDPSGRQIQYKLVRLIPPTPAEMGHQVAPLERLDQIAYRYYRDPERFWRICDANVALWPPDLVAESGRIISVPPSEG
jgi:hypothetical protein